YCTTTRRSPPSTLCPYTTLFRSVAGHQDAGRAGRRRDADRSTHVAQPPWAVEEDDEPGAGRALRRARRPGDDVEVPRVAGREQRDRKSTRLNSSHDQSSYAGFCL